MKFPGNAPVMVVTGKVGRALRGPPSGMGRGTNLTLLSCGGQGTARPTIQACARYFAAAAAGAFMGIGMTCDCSPILAHTK